MHGPVLIFDKSTLQSLSVDESCWLDNFYETNITPLFFVETLSDLEKDVARGRTPEQVVGNLAEKTPVRGSHANMHHSNLLIWNLLGEEVEIRRVPVIGGGTRVITGDQKGVLFKQPPEIEALERWQKGEFLVVERHFAKMWRRALSGLDLEGGYRQFQRFFSIGGKPQTLAEVKALVDRLLGEAEHRERILRLGCALLGVPHDIRQEALGRWQAAGTPPLPGFASYAAHVVSVDLFFYLALASDLISRERPSNKIDLAYLYYLPFSMVFASNDKLHARVVPLFLREDQEFVNGVDLKADLKKLDEYYSQLPEEVRRQGVTKFASWPPFEGDFLVTRLFDRFLPRWREIAKKPMKISKEVEAELIERLKRMKKGMPGDRGEEPIDVETADYVVMERLVPLQRGKWVLFSPEVIESSDE
ncbi:MAG: hypothetical protein ACE5JU_16615 [Candidatus Binatia bacterium]